VFASPAFCTNAVCGPQVEVATELREEYGDRVDFVHVDLYSNPREIQGDLDKAMLSPLLEEWGLVSQEWTFIVDSDGIVTHRFENFAPKPELVEALDQSVAKDATG
ncbi:MAG: thioredoxin family protein, partial [Chloroflexi bacterium]|nr:thioredoxin family protein [Chloroflexota bacterium]